MPVVHDATGVGTDSGARHLELLERAVSVALSPLDFPDATSWGDALTAALCALTNASAGAFLLPPAGSHWRALNHDASSDEMLAGWGMHEETTERLHDQSNADLVFWARDDLASADTPRRPMPLSGTIGVRVRTTGGAVAAVCVHRDRSQGPAPSHLIAALRTIAPAFRAGIATWIASSICRADITRMLDSLADPALMFDIAGRVTHANAAMQRLSSWANPTRLRDEAQRIAWALGAMARRRNASTAPSLRGDAGSDPNAVHSLRIGATVYRLRGTIIGEHLFGAEPSVLVTMTAAAVEPLSDEALQSCFGLTTREIQVARLVAEGLSNSEIADRLGVKFFTARNHVERTLAKLDVASRHRVGPLLRNEAPADAQCGCASAA
jgi:DNA-binding CsgD family transcriptional regulator